MKSVLFVIVALFSVSALAADQGVPVIQQATGQTQVVAQPQSAQESTQAQPDQKKSKKKKVKKPAAVVSPAAPAAK